MATAKIAHVARRDTPCPGTRVLELVADEPLGFIGGQYIIVDSGLLLPSGKAAKRAYSICSSDAEQRRFELAVKQLPGGVVSGFLHDLALGAEVRFSGPWGKLGPTEGAPDSTTNGATVILATDTGISAALGLIQAARMQPLLASTTLIWLQVDGERFLPEAELRARLPAGCAVQLAALPPIGHPERVPHARAVLAAALSPAVVRGYLAGDGAVNYALLDDLIAAGIAATRDSVESFFNMPKKSA